MQTPPALAAVRQEQPLAPLRQQRGLKGEIPAPLRRPGTMTDTGSQRSTRGPRKPLRQAITSWAAEVLRRLVASIAIAGVLLAACSPVYRFRYAEDMSPRPEPVELAARLATLLEPQGFQRLAVVPDEAPAIGATGFDQCPKAGDLAVFQKLVSSPRVGAPHRTWVHLFTCNGIPRFVVVSSSDSAGHAESSRTRDLLNSAFAEELANGSIHLERTHRLALE
jgi:hypothetical protein